MTTRKERRDALARMSKAELVKTIVALDSRQTKLLNEIAALKAEDLRAKFGDVDPGRPTTDTEWDALNGIDERSGVEARTVFPWEQK